MKIEYRNNSEFPWCIIQNDGRIIGAMENKADALLYVKALQFVNYVVFEIIYPQNREEVDKIIRDIDPM